jgi:single-strand DNA-binding protein
MALPGIQGEFGVVADPEIKFSDKGSAWLKIRGIAKDRVRDANGGWADGDPLFIDIIVGNGAEHLYESVCKGDTIIVTGRLKQRNWEKDGTKHSTMQISADTVGVSTRWGTARTQRAIESTSNPAQVVAQAFDMPQQTEAPF